MESSDGALKFYDIPDRSVIDSFDASQIEALEKINQRVAAADSVESLIDFLFETSHDLCPCDRVALAFVTDEGRRVTAHYARATYEPLRLGKGYAEQLAGSTLETIIESGQVRVIGDIEAYLEANPQSSSTQLVFREGLRSSMTCPLSVDGRNVGLLFRSSTEPFAYDEKQVAFHAAIAERLSQAVEKAWRIEQLDAANRAYTEMLSFVVHELKSPVASMMMDAEVLIGGYIGDITDQQTEKLRRMLAKGKYLLGLVNDYLNLARLEGGEMELKLSDVEFIGDVLTPAMEINAPQAEGKSMPIVSDIPPAAAIPCDPNLMQIVAVNLLSNAVKYGFESGEIRVSVADNDDAMVFSVRNEGPGFSEAAKSKLFAKFSRLDDPELKKAKGTGVGLYTVWRIVHKHGGTIVADSEKGSWAQFTVTLPKRHDD
jgi:signal transduction histidine kinase